MSEIPEKHCHGCGNDFPATTEFFYPNQGHLYSLCKKCSRLSKQRSGAKKKSENRIAVPNDHDNVSIPIEEIIMVTADAPTIPEKYCSACNGSFPATTEFFNVHGKTKDGLYSQCRECQRKGDRESRVKRERRIPMTEGDIPNIPAKECTVCHRIFPATPEFFHRHKNLKGGLYYQCKECFLLSEQRSNAKKRAEKQIAVMNGHDTTTVTTDEIGTQCDSCGTKSGNILGDIDPITKKRRGYLCMKCHRIVHHPQGGIKRLRDCIAYIEKTQAVEYN